MKIKLFKIKNLKKKKMSSKLLLIKSEENRKNQKTISYSEIHDNYFLENEEKIVID